MIWVGHQQLNMSPECDLDMLLTVSFILVILVSLGRVVKWDITWFTGMLMGFSIHVVNKTMGIKLRASNKPTTKIAD